MWARGRVARWRRPNSGRPRAVCRGRRASRSGWAGCCTCRARPGACSCSVPPRATPARRSRPRPTGTAARP
ncbi:hypothetical protein CF645_38755, partial [Burkholderia pseudomallei]